MLADLEITPYQPTIAKIALAWLPPMHQRPEDRFGSLKYENVWYFKKDVLEILYQILSSSTALRKRIDVIGAGPAGAIAVDCLAQERAFSVIRVFERRETGCWHVIVIYNSIMETIWRDPEIQTLTSTIQGPRSGRTSPWD
jgi:hypothetical protein